MADKEQRKLTALEVAMLVGTSVQVLGAWYRFKRENPDSEMAKMLPEFQRFGNRQTRYWQEDDIPKLLEFKHSIVHGRNGVMGSVTQRYVKGSKYAKSNTAD